MGSEVAAPGLLSTDSLVGVLGLSSSVAVGSSQVGVACIVRQIHYHRATREAPPCSFMLLLLSLFLVIVNGIFLNYIF